MMSLQLIVVVTIMISRSFNYCSVDVSFYFYYLLLLLSIVIAQATKKITRMTLIIMIIMTYTLYLYSLSVICSTRWHLYSHCVRRGERKYLATRTVNARRTDVTRILSCFTISLAERSFEIFIYRYVHIFIVISLLK